MHLHEQLIRTRQDDLLRAVARGRLAAQARRAGPAGRARAAAYRWWRAQVSALRLARMLSRSAPAVPVAVGSASLPPPARRPMSPQADGAYRP